MYEARALFRCFVSFMAPLDDSASLPAEALSEAEGEESRLFLCFAGYFAGEATLTP